MLQEKLGVSTYDELMLDFEDAVLKQRPDCLPSSKLSDIKETRFQSQINHRLTELEGSYFEGKKNPLTRQLLFQIVYTL